MEALFQKEEVIVESTSDVTAPKTKKRKVQQEEKKDELQELKQKAKLYSKCPEQWKIISKYGPDKLKTWVDEQEFLQTKALHETVFSFTQKIIGFAMDALSMGDDYVNKEILSDVSLRQSLEIEAGNWVSFLSNRFKIIALLSVDIANGKLKQREENKSTITVVEQIENGRDCSRNQSEGGGEVPGDNDEAKSDDHVGTQRVGEDVQPCDVTM